MNFSIPWFVPNKPLLPGQLFEGKVGAYQSGALTQDKTLKLKKKSLGCLNWIPGPFYWNLIVFQWFRKSGHMSAVPAQWSAKL